MSRCVSQSVSRLSVSKFGEESNNGESVSETVSQSCHCVPKWPYFVLFAEKGHCVSGFHDFSCVSQHFSKSVFKEKGHYESVFRV